MTGPTFDRPPAVRQPVPTTAVRPSTRPSARAIACNTGGVIALQRTAGNRAVTASVRPPIIQRISAADYLVTLRDMDAPARRSEVDNRDGTNRYRTTLAETQDPATKMQIVAAAHQGLLSWKVGGDNVNNLKAALAARPGAAPPAGAQQAAGNAPPAPAQAAPAAAAAEPVMNCLEAVGYLAVEAGHITRATIDALVTTAAVDGVPAKTSYDKLETALGTAVIGERSWTDLLGPLWERIKAKKDSPQAGEEVGAAFVAEVVAHLAGTMAIPADSVVVYGFEDEPRAHFAYALDAQRVASLSGDGGALAFAAPSNLPVVIPRTLEPDFTWTDLANVFGNHGVQWRRPPWQAAPAAAPPAAGVAPAAAVG